MKNRFFVEQYDAIKKRWVRTSKSMSKKEATSELKTFRMFDGKFRIVEGR